jgi:hypothetical protein
MAVDAEVLSQLSRRFAVLLPHLNERQRRLAVAAEARLLGHGGVRAVAQVAGMSETTVRRGVVELEAGEDPFPDGQVRVPGGGRHRVELNDPGVVSALLGLVEPDERGDPESPLRWTTKSLRHLAEELTCQGHSVTAPTVGRLLKQQGFSLQANAKTLEGAQHPDRDAQFRYLNDQVTDHQAGGEPVISVDTKKREQLGRLPMAGREWRPKGEPVEVEDHSFFFTGPEVEHAIPYGIYDLARNTGWVNVGVDHDTSEFAVESIRRWWTARGRLDYPAATRLLITADAGGSNSYRYRVWKSELAALAADTGLEITVCHFPPGTSKWNKIEHRLFSHITFNWRGRPLTSHEVVVNTIAATRTRAGLRVEAALDPGEYPTGITISKQRFAALPLRQHAVHSTWNYTLCATSEPSTPSGARSAASDLATARHTVLSMLADPRLTGMSHSQLDALTAALAPAQAARAEQRWYIQRGGRRRHAPGGGAKPLISDADRIVITLIYLRQICTQTVLAELLEIRLDTIGRVMVETRRLLEDHGQSVAPITTVRFRTATELREFLTIPEPAGKPTIAATDVSGLLADPHLTGMSRAEFTHLTERLALPQAAQTERRRRQQRGRDRLPGARGGVFRQKITDSDRVLITLLHQRNLCTQIVLAELFKVSEVTIRHAIRDTRSLLHDHGHAPTPTPHRFRTAHALLACIGPLQTEPSETTDPPS